MFKEIAKISKNKVNVLVGRLQKIVNSAQAWQRKVFFTHEIIGGKSRRSVDNDRELLSHMKNTKIVVFYCHSRVYWMLK